jgi:hypothetical protein
MKCDQCSTTIESGEERDHLGQRLCEDCFIDAVSTVKPCDPWAVHSARSYEKHAGKDRILTPPQLEILRILEADGAMEPSMLLKKLGGKLQLRELEREFATLRHMEKVRGEKQGPKVLWRLW